MHNKLLFRSFGTVSTTLLTAIALWLAPLRLDAQSALTPPVDTFTGHPRAVIVSDMGNEPDDQMSFVRLLLYSNELDLEATPSHRSRLERLTT